MSIITGDVKKLFAYKYKKRDDCLTDQYSRLFMTKAMLVGAFITGMQWYSDEIKCAVPAGLAGKHLGGYTGKACWINGFYVYEQLRKKTDCEGYFGIPVNIQHNGTLRNKACETCVALEGHEGDINCLPMRKKFYIQYQWYPFFLAAMSLFYYLPYFIFTYANDDLKSLKGEIKKVKPDIDVIVKNYFDLEDDSLRKQQRVKIALNIVMKLIYLISNVAVFVLCDSTLNGDFKKFGTKWLNWAKLPDRNNYVERRSFIDAGELLLPTFGYCDVLEEWVDIKHSVVNEHKLLCEISQHILYQYVLMALWFLIVLGIALSVYGLVSLLITYGVWEIEFDKGEQMSKKVHKHITIRQGEYLMFIRRKNELVYGAILDNLYSKLSNEEPSDDRDAPFVRDEKC
jgi:hypothetical protein